MRVLGKELETPDLIFAALLVVGLVWQASIIGQLKALPSPMYGGDYYNELGVVNHILGGGSVFENAQMIGEHPWTPWLHHLLIAIFSMVTGMEAVNGMLYFSLVAEFLTLIVVYLFAEKVSGNKYAALAAAVLVAGRFPEFKYSGFATWLIVPLFAWALAEFMEKKDRKSAVLAGIGIGLMGLSNTQAFFVAFLMLGIAAIWMLYPRIKEKGLKVGALVEQKEILVGLGAMFAVGFVLCMPFWFAPIFVFHGHTMNDIQNFALPDMSKLDVVGGMAYALMLSFLLPYGLGFPGIAFSALNLAGLYFVVKNPGKYGIAVVLLIAALFGIVHPLVTVPLAGTQLIPSMMYERPGAILTILLIAVGIAGLAGRIKDGKTAMAAMGICLLLSGMVMVEGVNAITSGQWWNVGKQALPGPYVELESWIKGNTDVNDVFMTTNEDGFMMNALTGRKVVSYRRAHSSPYTDMHTRMADQAVMVYGTNGQKTSELLSKYDVKYVLVAYNWVTNEFRVSDQGQLTGFFDPLNIPNNATNKEYWDANGVKYVQATMSLDPAPAGSTIMYDMLVALPYPLQQGGPVSPTLMSKFRLVKEINYEGYKMFAVYERI